MKKFIFILTILISSICFSDDAADVSNGHTFYSSRSFAAVTQEFVFATGARAFFGRPPRVSISISAQTSNTSYAVIDWYESTSFGAGSLGTALTVYNANRDTRILSQASITHSPIAFTTAGTTLMPSILVPFNQVSGFYRQSFNPVDGSGWVLKNDTQYFFRITPSSSTATFYVRFDWRE